MGCRIVSWIGSRAIVSDTPSPTPSADAAATEPSTASTKVRASFLCSVFPYLNQSLACASCGYPSAKIRSYEWGQKAKRRKTTGTGRMRYLKDVSRRFKNGFRLVFFQGGGRILESFFSELPTNATSSTERTPQRRSRPNLQPGLEPRSRSRSPFSTDNFGQFVLHLPTYSTICITPRLSVSLPLSILSQAMPHSK